MNGLNYIITRHSQLIWVVGVFNGERVVFPIFFTIPSGVSIDGESVLLIGGEGVSNPIPDVIVPADNDLSFGSGGSNADAVRLLHRGPGVADTVIYGPTSDDGIAENTDGWTDDLGDVHPLLQNRVREHHYLEEWMVLIRMIMVWILFESLCFALVIPILLLLVKAEILK